MYLVSQRNKALAYHQLGQHNTALQILKALPDAVGRINEQNERAEIYLASGEVLRDQGYHEQALEQISKALELSNTTGNSTLAAQCMLERGWVLIDQEAFAQAQRCFETALPHLHQRPMYLWRILYGQARCAEKRKALQEALAAYREASKIIARLRIQLLSEHASSGIFKLAEAAHRDALRLAHKLGDARLLVELAETQRALSLGMLLRRSPSSFTSRTRALDAQLTQSYLQHRPDTLETLIKQLIQQRISNAQSPDILLQALAEAPPEPQLDLDGLMRAWSITYKAGWTALIYLHCDDQLICIAYDANDPEPHVETINASESLQMLLQQACNHVHIDDRLKTFFNADQAKHPDKRWLTLDQLGHLLIPPKIQQRLAPERRLLIVPSAKYLHALPWAALRVQGRWLAEAAIIQLLPALDLWPLLANRRSHQPRALLMAITDFKGKHRSLPAAINTLTLAKQHWPGSAVALMQENVSSQQLMEQAAAGKLREYSLIHIATHAKLFRNQGHGLLTHLVLDDGELFYDDIVGLNLKDALVVLVACQGANEHEMPGEEVLSLNRAFLAAGARDVIANIWDLYSSSVLDLIKPLYEALRKGEDAPTAVATVQRALIANTQKQVRNNDFLASPAMWAGLSAMGAGIVGWPPAGGTNPADNPNRHFW